MPFGHFLPGQCPNRLSSALIARASASDRAAAVGKPVVVLKVGRGERTREFTTAPLYPTRSRGKG
jgi:hypothetical protein